jgi:hypothetical protein
MTYSVTTKDGRIHSFDADFFKIIDGDLIFFQTGDGNYRQAVSKRCWRIVIPSPVQKKKEGPQLSV